MRAKLRELRTLDGEDNARFMDGAQYQQLVANLKTDGVLTSVPLVYRGTIYSGNHRVKAAIDADIEEADVLEILSECTPERLRALQLAHNAIVGKDDPNVLSKLYEALDLAWKRYSGLSDNILGGLKELDIKAMAVATPAYQELVLLFLPEEQTKFLEAVDKVQKRVAKGAAALAGRFEDFDAFFAALVKTKRVKGINNSAVALRAMADLAIEALDAVEAKEPANG